MLTSLPVEIEAGWRSRRYTTDPPRYVPFDVWTLVVTLRCAAPIRVAALFAEGDKLCWTNRRSPPGAIDHELSARFGPNDWLGSDEVHLSFDGAGAWLTDSELKLDPRPLVRLERAEAVTGRPAIVATIPRFGIAFGAIAFAQEDTERRRQGRWRVRPRLSSELPPELQGLTSGYQSGEARWVPPF